MTTIVLPLDAASGSPSFSAQATRQAFSALAGAAPSGRPLGATSGVRPGTPSTTVTATGFTWSCAAHAGVLDVQASAAAGPYLYATDGTDTGSITAANGTNPRVDIIYVQVNDNVQDSSGSEGGLIGYLAGTPAASPVAPSPPNSRCMVLANINVPVSGGGNPSVSWVAPTFGQQGWTSYTPTLGNITLGNGSVAAKYAVDANKVVTVRFLLVAGSTTSYSAGTFTVSLPVPPKSVYVDPNWNSTIGIANVSCPASANRQMGMVIVAADGAARIIVSGGPVSNTVPGAWGSSSALSFTATYESA